MERRHSHRIKSNYNKEMKRVVSRRRHFAKSLTWRIISSSSTAIIAYIFGLPLKAIGIIFICDMIFKFLLYYVHERIWYEKIKYGVKDV